MNYYITQLKQGNKSQEYQISLIRNGLPGLAYSVGRCKVYGQSVPPGMILILAMSIKKEESLSPGMTSVKLNYLDILHL